MLWRNLLQPPDHPLFGRIVAQRIDRRWACLMWIAPLVGLLSCCGSWIWVNQWQPSILVFILIPTTTFSSFYVAAWVISITATLSREREKRTYEQFCLPPSGALGANIAIIAAMLHREDALGWLDFLRKLISGLLLFTLLSVMLITASRESAPNFFQVAQIFLDIVVVGALTYIEHVQSVVLGSLIAMFSPLYSRTNVDAHILAIGAFLSSQTLALAAAFFTAMILSDLYLNAAGGVIVSPTLLSLLVFYLLREGFIFALWSILIHRLNIHPSEFSYWYG